MSVSCSCSCHEREQTIGLVSYCHKSVYDTRAATMRHSGRPLRGRLPLPHATPVSAGLKAGLGWGPPWGAGGATVPPRRPAAPYETPLSRLPR